jgi:predicted dehydrogenase
MKKVKCGIIGCGLMGREFAAAVARWPALLTLDARPEIIAVCDLNKELFPWYTANFDSIHLASTEYHELLDDQEIEFIYCAVPHHLHENIYIDIIRAGKHLMAEKPFGINKDANRNILHVID